jgi:hypothetical protein
VNIPIMPPIALELLQIICDDFEVPIDKIYSKYNRGRVSKVRQIFALVATDVGMPHLGVSAFLGMDPSYVTQVRRRKYALRRTTEYHHAFGMISAMEKWNANSRLP